MGVEQSHSIRTSLHWTFISYHQLCESIDHLNALTSVIQDRNGRSLLFKVKRGTEETSWLWRGMIRIQCLKVSGSVGGTAAEVLSRKLLTLRQFLTLRNALLNQLSYATPPSSSTNQIAASSSSTNQIAGEATSSSPPPSSTNQINDMDVSMLVANLGDKEVELCCICMERGTDLLLPCTHEYCLPCIQQWSYTGDTCPECRDTLELDDSLVVIEKPDYREIREQLASDLANIPD